MAVRLNCINFAPRKEQHSKKMNISSSNKVKGFAAGIIAAICYGTNPLGTLQLYADGINPGSVLVYRYLLAVIMFAIVMVYRKEDFRIKWGYAIRFAFLGVFFSMSSATLYLSFRYMAAGIASTLLFVYPIMTAVLMTTFYHERVTWTSSAAILLAVTGVGLLYQGDGDAKLSTVGFALVMMSSLVYSLYIISVNRWEVQMSPIKYTFWVLVFGLITMLVYCFVAGEEIQMLTTPIDWLCALQIALLPTVLSLFFMTISIKLIGSTPAAIMGAVEPVTAVVIGVFVWGESFTVQLAIGIVLILSGVTLIILRKQPAEQ